MKIKVIPAYLPESSVTVRLTPQSIGELLASFRDYVKLYRDEEYRKAVSQLMKDKE